VLQDAKDRCNNEIRPKLKAMFWAGGRLLLLEHVLALWTTWNPSNVLFCRFTSDGVWSYFHEVRFGMPSWRMCHSHHCYNVTMSAWNIMSTWEERAPGGWCWLKKRTIIDTAHCQIFILEAFINERYFHLYTGRTNIRRYTCVKHV
jgi:hypothetical protein